MSEIRISFGGCDMNLNYQTYLRANPVQVPLSQVFLQNITGWLSYFGEVAKWLAAIFLAIGVITEINLKSVARLIQVRLLSSPQEANGLITQRIGSSLMRFAPFHHLFTRVCRL